MALSIDVQGPAVVEPYVTKAGCNFPVLVDQDNITGATFGIKLVPYAVALNPDLTLAAGPFKANIDDPQFLGECQSWVTDGTVADSWNETLGTPLADHEKEALKLLVQARQKLQEGEQEQALELLRQGYHKDPKNWLIRKQMWVVEHPDKFYRGEKPDYDWQKVQLEQEQRAK